MQDARSVHVKVIEIAGAKRFVTVLAPVEPNERDRFWQKLRPDKFRYAPETDMIPNSQLEYAITKQDQSM